MKKIIFIEGLPSVGKTYLVNKIKEMNLQNVYVVDEIINPDIENPFIDSEDKFLKNDEMKVNKFDDGIIIIDRGPISTLVYNQVLHIIDNKYAATIVEEWFNQFLDIYKNDNTYNYYLNKKQELYKQDEKTLSCYDAIKDLKNLSKERPFLKEVDSCALRCAVFNLEDSFKNFFEKKRPYMILNPRTEKVVVYLLELIRDHGLSTFCYTVKHPEMSKVLSNYLKGE